MGPPGAGRPRDGGPTVTTLVDGTGLIIYFQVAKLLLKL